jgi:hypothetical protein
MRPVTMPVSRKVEWKRHLRECSRHLEAEEARIVLVSRHDGRVDI